MIDRIQQIDRYLDGQLDASAIEELFAWIAADDANAEVFARQTLQAEQLQELLGNGFGTFGPPLNLQATPTDRADSTATRKFASIALFAATAALLLVVLAGLGWQWSISRHSIARDDASSKSLQPIARIAALDGPFQWTGNSGLVSHDLSIDSEVTGGTLEGLAPDSWCELEFLDGSTVTLSDNSRLTISDDGQKTLHFRQGSLSCNVTPQPADKPMLIYTRTALLEVVGTQFEVEAELDTTGLSVHEGKVRVKRLSDGSIADVAAQQQLVTSVDLEMSPHPIPEAVEHWQSRLEQGPGNSLGKWSSATDGHEATLRAVAHSRPNGKTIYAVRFKVAAEGNPPIALHLDSKIRIRGRLSASESVLFGFLATTTNGDYLGHFRVILPASEFAAGEEFEIELPVRVFERKPTTRKIPPAPPGQPHQHVMKSFWGNTDDKNAGLEIFEVELLPPDSHGTEKS